MNAWSAVRFASAFACLFFVFCMNNPDAPEAPPGRTSNGYFIVFQPSGGTRLSMGSTVDIRWSFGDSLTNIDTLVTFGLYEDDSLVRSISARASNNGTYSWTVSAPASGSRFRIRISCYYNSEHYDYGPYFTIVSPYSGTISVSQPAQGSSFSAGSTMNVQWTTTGNLTSTYMRLDLYNDTQFVSTLTSSTTNDGLYSWIFSSPPAGTGNRYRIKVLCTSDMGIYGFSGYFSLSSAYSGTITVTNPADTSSWSAGTLYYIEWDTTGNPGSYVIIELYNGGQLISTLTTMTTDDGSQSWTVPAYFSTGNAYRFKVTSYYDPSICGWSDSFSIAGVAADGYEPDNIRDSANAFTPGDTQLHTMAYNDTDWISLVADSGAVYLLAAPGQASLYSYLYSGTSTSYTTYYTFNYYSTTTSRWTCPKSGAWYFRNTPAGYYGTYAFSIRRVDTLYALNFTAPDSQTVWSAGSIYQIRWAPDSTLLGSYVSIYLWDDATKRSTLISSSQSNSGVYSWSVPSGLMTRATYRIRLYNYSDNSLYGQSQRFTISGIAADSFEVDDSASSAKDIGVDGTVQNHTMASSDIDWMKFPVQKDSMYLIRTSGATSVYLYLYSKPDSAYLASRSGAGAQIFWTATFSGTAYLKTQPYSLYGSYGVSVKKYAQSSVATFYNPIASSTLAGGTMYTIQWQADTALFGTYVYLYLYNGNRQVVSIGYVANDGSQTWTPDAGLATGSHYRIVISGSSTYAATGSSEEFTISGMATDDYEWDNIADSARSITTDGSVQNRTLTRPDTDWVSFAGQSGKLYSVQVSGMTSTLRLYDVNKISQLQSTTGSATTPAKIVYYCLVTGTYYFAVAGSSTGGYQASVMGYDTSAYRFRITRPAAGDSIVLSASDNITWTADVNVGGLVDVFLYRNNSVVGTIAPSTANDGSLNWTPALVAGAAAGDGYTIRIISLLNAAINATSGAFVIKP